MEELHPEVCVDVVFDKESSNLGGYNRRQVELPGLQVSLFNGRKAVEDRGRVRLENHGACHLEKMAGRLSKDLFDNLDVIETYR